VELDPPAIGLVTDSGDVTDDDPWAEYAADWDDDEGARIYAASAHRHLLDLLDVRGPALDEAVVCDFGAGTGLLTEHLVGRVARVDAVDSSPAMLEQLRRKVARRGWSTVTVGLGMPDAVGRHDLVVCSSVLGFVDDLDVTVAALAGLLRPGGALVVWDWERTDDHDHGLTRSEIHSALTDAGLTDVLVESAFRFRIEGEAVWPLSGVAWRNAT